MKGARALGLILAWACLSGCGERRLAAKGRSDFHPAEGLGPIALMPALPSLNRANGLESGNIGAIKRIGPFEYELALRSDNDDNLPEFWRQWWYTQVSGLSTKRATTLTLTGRGHWNYYLPVYSYDNVNWRQFHESEVTQPSRHTLRMTKTFARPTVYLARYYPYPYSKMLEAVAAYARHPHVKRQDIGPSPEGREIPALTVTDPEVPTREKIGQVIIHARTHPGEVASSYLLDGMVRFMASGHPEARAMRRRLIFRVVPMLNVDGVVAGNNRVTPYGVNLEGKWYTVGDTSRLDFAKAPPEVRSFYRAIRRWQRSGPPVTMALNLHSSNGEPEDKTFFFPHFGPRRLGYDAREAKLWHDQLRFIQLAQNIRGPEWFNRLPKEGTRAFLAKHVPESWWWKEAGPSVMALTIEATFGKAGNNRRWIQPKDMQELGEAFARAIGLYHPDVKPLRKVADGRPFVPQKSYDNR